MTGPDPRYMKAKNDSLECWSSNHTNSWAAFPSVIDISNGNTIRRDLAEIAQPFFFDLTCDVIGGPDVNETRFPSTNRPELSNAVGNFQIGTAVGAYTERKSYQGWLVIG